MKGMYKADAVIYLGHGGHVTENYNNNGGTAKPPFALVGSNDFVWGVGTKIREGFKGKTVTAPFKPNIPVILSHTCFSAGWISNREVANPTETIYHFSQMFTGAGANYYATGHYGSYQRKKAVDIVDEFLNGATSFNDANKKNTGRTITKSTTYNGKVIWRNSGVFAAFVGNWSAIFPRASQTTAYNDLMAEAWYQSVVLGKTDKTPLKVKSTSPLKSATGVSLTSPVTIIFSENIKTAAKFSGIYIKNLSTGKKMALASKIISGKILTLKMKSSRTKSNVYRVYLPAGAVKDGVGNSLASAYSYSFKTTVDTTPPKVSGTKPAKSAKGVSLTSLVTITFSENVKSGSKFSGIYIKNLSTGKKVTLALKTIRGKILTLKMKSSRTKNNLYQVYIPAGTVKDAAGNSLKSSYSFQFRTIK